MKVLLVSAIMTSVIFLTGVVLGNFAYSVLCKLWKEIKDLEIK